MCDIFSLRNNKTGAFDYDFLIINNFLSFCEETVFDMFPNVKREKFQHHIYTGMKAPLLKQAVIYGANGSGKSNFIKALSFLRNFIIDANFLNSVDFDDYIFRTPDLAQIGLSRFSTSI